MIAYIAAVAAHPFGYGRMDCTLFVAGAVAAMTGVGPAVPHRGRYRSLQGGLKRLRRQGFPDHVAFVAARLRAIPVARATAGDLAVLPGPQGPALGLVRGTHIYVMAEAGLALVPLLDAEAAFEVPR